MQCGKDLRLDVVREDFFMEESVNIVEVGDSLRGEREALEEVLRG